MLKNITPLATIHFLDVQSVIGYAASVIPRCSVPSKALVPGLSSQRLRT